MNRLIEGKAMPIGEAVEKLTLAFKDFGLEIPRAPRQERIAQYLSAFRTDLWLFLEFPYIDKHYRDGYYSYHSAKHQEYSRDTIRVHVFSQRVFVRNLLNLESQPGLQKNYLGYFILRPLPNYPIGRSLLSPKAFRKQDFVCCLTKGRVSLFGTRLQVFGFPHVAQDYETHKCAESALWSVLEYFGTRYPEYRPVLPSEILQSLSTRTNHRLLPSIGLPLSEMTQVLLSLGHPCMTYYRKNFEPGTEAFFSLLHIYVESGIPVLIALSSTKGEGHAVVAIGHTIPKSGFATTSASFSLTSTDTLQAQLVFVDDNRPPYQSGSAAQPTAHYPEPSLQNLQIQAFVVPLQRHMHLDALAAEKIRREILEDPTVGLKALGAQGPWLSRFFLTSSRSFKEKAQGNDVLDKAARDYLCSLALPKFIWVCELSEQRDYLAGICEGLLILDATSDPSNDSVLVYWFRNKEMVMEDSRWVGPRELAKIRFSQYKNNLKGEWSEWEL